MHLDKQTDYSLRVLMYLAANRGRLSTIAEIAERFRISKSHLMKVVYRLGKAGYVETVRGRSGGIRLVGDGSTIRVGDVVRQMESDLSAVECLGVSGGQCLIASCCRLKGALRQATDAFLSVLDDLTIADLVRQNHPLAHLLGDQAA